MIILSLQLSLQDADTRGAKTFFTEIVASISSIKFAPDGRHVLSRDYLNLKVFLCYYILHLLTVMIVIMDVFFSAMGYADVEFASCHV